MADLATYRTWNMHQLKRGAPIIEYIVRTAERHALTTYRDDGSGWTVLEVLCHLRDYEDLFLARVRTILADDGGTLPYADPDTLAAEHAYMSQDIDTVLHNFITQRDAHLSRLEALSDDQWEQPTATHPRRGTFTLTDHLLLAVRHDVDHLEQMVRILREKKTGA